MQAPAVQDILAGVEKPSRYIGTEINRVIKDPSDSNIGLRMVLAFPDLYEIGSSHFGLQILYHLINRHPRISAERVFAPAADMEAALRRNNTSLFSLETSSPLREFQIIGFSLLYELNFTNVLNMLDLAGIPLYADQRSDQDPIIIAGGPCVANPEPMAPFFDAMVFGDGENVLPEMAETFLRWRKAGGQDKPALLYEWSQIEGIYIPSLFNAVVGDDGFQRLVPLHRDYTHVTRAIVPDLDRSFFPQQPIIAYGKPVHDRLRLEIARGCSRGCRFCQAGMIYRPVRERSMPGLLELAEKALAATGYEDLSLLSLSTGDYSCLSPLIERLMQRCRSERTAVSLPSIRAGTLTPQLMEHIKKVRKTGFTIAPEAGSARLRDVINKNITFENVKTTVTDAFALGWKVIKLYFMIGLPTETEEDLDAIVELVAELKKIPVKRHGKLNISFSTFIPKAHTPFQWASQITLKESHEKIEYLKRALRWPGVQVKWQNPAMSLLEGVFARGDRRLAGIIESAFRSGCRFDGWSDHFEFDRWQQVFEKGDVSSHWFTTRKRSIDEPLPWAHMDSRVTSDFLESEWNAAMAGSPLEDCRKGACHQCGVCDFNELLPRFSADEPDAGTAGPADPGPPEEYRTVELIYSKRNGARFFGHLEVASIFARALKRAKIDLLHSQGFHPMPRISFDDPLPLGMESCGERLVLRVAAHVACAEIVEGLRRQLPQGLDIVACRQNPEKGVRARDKEITHYHIFATPVICADERIERFRSAPRWDYCRRRKARNRDIDLKSVVAKLGRIDQKTVAASILRKADISIRPSDLLRGVFDLDEHQLTQVRVLKLASENTEL